MDDPVLRVQSQLTARDRVLLGWLYDHGVLTSFQIAHALFPSLDFCQRRLLTLYRLRLVGRFRPQRADGGSYPYHYVIDQLGVEVVAAGRDQRPPRRDHARVERRRWTSSRTLEHRLGVNGFFTDLAGYARTHPDARLGSGCRRRRANGRRCSRGRRIRRWCAPISLGSVRTATACGPRGVSGCRSSSSTTPAASSCRY